jgi:hypothetical protein
MKKLFSVTLLLFSLTSFAQYYNDGQDRASINWKRISTIHFEVIYPEGFEITANKVAALMEKSYEYTTVTLKQKPKKISILLHSETVKSNAFLGWAPSRIEMYATPHQQIYAQDWLEQLAIHEYRHAVQLNKLETEMPKLLRWLFGEQAAAMLSAAYLPFWFIEGDAVSVETGLSNSGRGRFPDFHRGLRTQVIEKGIFSYDKAYLGSYKDEVANYYNLGYFLVGGARMIYDKPVWEEVIHNVARKPLSLFAFDNGLKKSIGLNKVELYDTVFNLLKERWIAEDNSITPTACQVISPKHQYFTDYKFGFKNEQDFYIAERSGLSDINRFVSISESGKEKTLFTPGYHFGESVSGTQNYLVWTERLAHLRWDHYESSLLRILNTTNKKLTEHRFRKKLFAPTLSPDLKTIAAVEVDNQYRCFLDLIDMESGELIRQIETRENDFLMTPSWSSDGKNIVLVILRNNEKGIAKINIETESLEILLPFRNQEISKPEIWNNELYYIGGYTGINDLYVLRKDGLFRVISSRFGLRDFSFDNSSVVYSNYTSDGYQLVKSHVDSLRLTPVNIQSIQKEYPIAKAIAKQEIGVIDFSQADSVKYSSDNYSKVGHLFNIHSWAPLAIDPYTYTVDPGVSIMSQNMLSTAEFIAGYRYLSDTERGELYAKYNYYGWYPEINTEITHGKQDSYYYQLTQYQDSQNQTVRVDTTIEKYSWSQSNLNITASVPFNLSKGKMYRMLQPIIRYKATMLSEDNNTPEFFPTGLYHTLETELFFYQIQTSSQQDLLPNFGIILDFLYVKSLPGVADFGSLISFYNILYLPGLAPNHGLKLYNAYQRKESSDYSFSNRIQFPRGHSSVLNNEIYSFASDYMFPLCYPDFNIGRWAYLKRLKMSLSYDYAFITTPIVSSTSSDEYQVQLQSAGIELTADVNLLRFIAPLELGVRSNYLFDKTFDFDFIWSIEFTF